MRKWLSSKLINQNKNALPKVAVAGCGYWGKNLIRNFHQLDVLDCVCDIDVEAADEIAVTYGVRARPFEEILADDEIQGVVISTPAEQHAKMAGAALSAKKNVYVEKPLALQVSDAEELCRLAERTGQVLMVGHLLQYHPAFQKLKEICESGTLGTLQYVYSNRLSFGKIRTEENILWSFAPHDISMILGLLGDDLESVSAIGHSYLNHDLADVTTTHMKFSRNRAAHIFVSWLHPFKEQRLVVVGEKGMALFDDTCDWSQKIKIFPHQVNWDNGVPVPSRAEHEAVPLDEAEPLNLECQHFLDCIQNGKTPHTDGLEGVRVLRILDVAQRSMETGKTHFL